jgi:cell division septation protein DedD
MDNKATTKRMIGAVVLVLVAALLLAFLLKGKNREGQDMANQTTETKPILGFPGVGDADQKPMLVGEDPNAAQNAAGTTASQTADPNAVGAIASQAVDAAGNLIPNVETVPNTTGFDVRPATGGETRQLVDTDGKVKDGTGSLGAGDAKAATGAGTTATAGVAAEPAVAADKAGTVSKADVGKDSASKADSVSNKDKPVETVVETEKKPAASPKPVLVNEKPVPSATSSASKASADAAAKKAAAEKAAAAKSLELAKSGADAGTATTTTTASTSGYAIQLVASSDKAKAAAVAATFKAEGYKTTVVAAKVDGKTVYRAVISGYADKAAATAAQAKMKARFTQNSNVQSSFVTKQ